MAETQKHSAGMLPGPMLEWRKKRSVRLHLQSLLRIVVDNGSDATKGRDEPVSFYTFDVLPVLVAAGHFMLYTAVRDLARDVAGAAV